MPKWKDESPEWNRDRKPHPSDCLYEVFTEDLGNFISGTDNETRRDQFIRAHNADIDALTAERDELQRRLDAVVAKISEAVVSDDDCVCSMLCHSAILAIAEGRDNE